QDRTFNQGSRVRVPDGSPAKRWRSLRSSRREVPDCRGVDLLRHPCAIPARQLWAERRRAPRRLRGDDRAQGARTASSWQSSDAGQLLDVCLRLDRMLRESEAKLSRCSTKVAKPYYRRGGTPREDRAWLDWRVPRLTRNGAVPRSRGEAS